MAATPGQRWPRFRWFVVAMLAAAAVLNYLDRQTLALMAGTIQGQLRISDVGYATLVNAFLAAYTIGGLISALIVDRLGARRSMALFVGWWSLASALSGMAGSMWQLAATRFALGIAEAGGWIASPKLVQEWFPNRERALAIGIYSSAAHFGAALAPILITTLLITVGWRATFVVTGAIGLTWLAVWQLTYRPNRIGPVDKEAVPEQRAGRAPAEWGAVLRTRGVWLIAIGNALTNPVWFFYLFWFPKYLTEERGLTVAEMGRLSWVVYASAGVGSVLGGIISGALVRRGMRPARARVATMALVAVIAPIGAFNALAPAVSISLALGALVALVHTAWVTNQTALCVDLYPGRHIGKVMAVNGIIGGLATIVTTHLVGELVATITYRPMFLMIAIAYPLGLLAAFLATTGRSMLDREIAA
ncbi:MFS transporter [Sphingomonas asaccharolytica]|uniref:MFS transporter n=1 Tax=Sphingomonas asaccharolytica TaxID=40681 RepID=UPI000A03C2CA|nr:MFS transporter [Sphingomonas asaccharolytica]